MLVEEGQYGLSQSVPALELISSICIAAAELTHPSVGHMENKTTSRGHRYGLDEAWRTRKLDIMAW